MKFQLSYKRDAKFFGFNIKDYKALGLLSNAIVFSSAMYNSVHKWYDTRLHDAKLNRPQDR